MILTLSVFVSVIATVLGGGWTPPPTTTWPTEPPIILTQRQKDLQLYCGLQCNYAECALRNNKDCRLYVRCVQQPDGSYFGFDQACAIGTKHLKDGRCVNAPNDPCLDTPCAGRPNGYTEAYPDERCNTFIECQNNGKSVPYCCPPNRQYNESLGACVPDISCASSCPLQPQGVCDSSEVTTAPGENCASYVECVLDVAEKRCCNFGYRYDDLMGSCVLDAGCQQGCIPPIQKTCEPGMIGYSTPDSCGSYVECKDNEPYKRRCCQYGYGWNDGLQMCVPLPEDRPCVLECPPKYTYPCPLKAVLGRPDMFMRPPNTQMEKCADGTLFSEDDCACIKNPSVEENACPLELGLDFKDGNIEKSGSEEWSYIAERGPRSGGEIYEGYSTFKFNWYGLEIPLYHAEFHEFTFSVVFYPDQNNYRTILLSNCKLSDNNPQPSLEIIVDQEHATLSFNTDAPRNFNVGVTIGAETWNSLTVVYTGEIAYIQNEYGGMSYSNSISAQGTIPQATTGLNCGGCGNFNGSFKGSIAKYQFSRCVDPAWMENGPIGI